MEMLLIIPALFILAVWTYYADKRSSAREFAACTVERDAWLKSQESEQKYKVVVITKANKKLESKVYDPAAQVEYCLGGWQVIHKSSKLRATLRVEGTIEGDRFRTDDGDLYIPMCEIESLQVVKAE